MKISAEIGVIATSNNILVERLSDEYAKVIRKKIVEKYLDSQPRAFLWETFKEAAVIEDCNGWKKLCDFVGDNRCIMFFDDGEDDAMLVINDGNALYKLLSEMFGFEFYITNFKTNYVLCFNHHDCLVGCGTAAEWIKPLIR